MRDKIVQCSKRFFALLIIIILAMSNGIMVKASTAMETDLLLINLDEDKNIAMGNNEIADELYQLGQTIVIYGRNLDVETINQTYFPEDILVLTPAEKQIEENELSTTEERNIKSVQKNKAKTVDDKDAIYQTYAIVGTNAAGKTSLSYYSLCYPTGMEMESIWNEVLLEENMTKIAREFAEKKQMEVAKRELVADEAVDNTSYYDTYYPTGMTSSFSMKMYEKGIIYQAVKVDDAIVDYDYYYVTAYVSITPGNSITQTNSAYKNALVVIGSQTDITKGKSTDSFITVAPNHSSVETLIKNKRSFYSVANGSDGTLSIGFTWTPANMVKRKTSLSASNFMNFYSGQDSTKKWCISTNTFTYEMGAYIRSYGSNFSCNVNTQVKTLFQNQGIANAKWSGNSKSLSYNAR